MHMLSAKSSIFVYSAFGKGKILFYLLTKTIAIRAGDLLITCLFFTFK